MKTRPAKKTKNTGEYTLKEEEYIIKTVQKKGSNKETYEKIASKLNRTSKGIQQRVSKLRKNGRIKIVGKNYFTQQEDAIIVDFIKNKQYKNLQEAFRKLSVILKRNVRSIDGRYYNNLKNNYDMFQLVSGNTVLSNTKFVHEGKHADFKPFQYIVKQIMDLPREERDKVFAFFK